MAQNDSTVWHSSEELHRKLTEARFKRFDELDWQGYGGVEGDDPWIFYNVPGHFVIVLDDSQVKQYMMYDSINPDCFGIDFKDLPTAAEFAILLSKQVSSSMT